MLYKLEKRHKTMPREKYILSLLIMIICAALSISLILSFKNILVKLAAFIIMAANCFYIYKVTMEDNKMAAQIVARQIGYMHLLQKKICRSL